jgi:cytochrome P450
MIAPWVLHRHRRLWRDPDAFDPARFLPDAPPPPRFAYLPFGAGPRVCVGAQFALAEATLVLAALTRSFHIARADATPVLPVAIVTTQPDHAPMFRLRARGALLRCPGPDAPQAGSPRRYEDHEAGK